MGRLRNLDVQRTDAVGSPASGHKWVILKSANAEVEKAEGIAKTAGDALAVLFKEAAGLLSKEAVDALTALAAALEIEVDAEFTAKSETEEPAAEAAPVNKDDEDTADDTDDDTPDPATTDTGDDTDDTADDDAGVEKESYTREEVEQLLKDGLAGFGIDVATVEKGIELGTTRLVVKSRQPKDVPAGGERTAVKKGDGLFEDVVFS